jgi:hypothetical protein
MTVSVKAPTSTTGSIQLNGSDVLTIDSSGNLTAPNNLTVTGTVSSTGNVAFDTDTLYVDATNNRVGIGTSSPTQNLQIYNNGATSGQIHITNTSTGATASDGVLFGYDGSNDVIINNQEATATKFYTNTAERMRIASNGNVYINNTTSPPATNGFTFDNTGAGGYSFLDIGHFNGATTVGSYVRFYYGGAQIGKISGASASSVAYVTTSDYRLKENNVNIADGISRVKLLKPYRFNFIAEPDNTVDGFYAHEVQSVVPEAVVGTKDEVDNEGNPEYQGIDQSKLVPLLTAALQEAITKIEDLETRIETLENPNG